MNAVELDVGNLNQWLINTASGKKVNYLNQNGYLLYFSDRRGMVQDTNAANLTYGECGFEDVSTLARVTGTPDGALEAQANGLSPEDADENGKLDAWGGSNVGADSAEYVQRLKHHYQMFCAAVEREQSESDIRFSHPM